MNGVKFFAAAAVLTSLFHTILAAWLPLPMDFRVVDLVLIGWLIVSLTQGMKLPTLSHGGGGQRVILLFLLITVGCTLLGVFFGNYTSGELMRGIAPTFRTLIYVTALWLTFDGLQQRSITPAFLIKIVLVCGFIHFGYALIQFCAINLNSPSYTSLPWQPTRLQSDGREVSVSHVATGFTDAPFSLSSLGGMVTLLSYGLLIQGTGQVINRIIVPSRIWLWSGYLTGMAMIAMSYRRTTLISVVTTLIFLIVLKFSASSTPAMRKQGKAVIFFTLLILFIGIGWFISQSEALQGRMLSLLSLAQGNYEDPKLQNLQGRSEVTWGFWIHLFEQHPWGVGLYAPAIYRVGSDNSYLTYLAQGGIIYAFSYIWVLLCLLKTAWNCFRHKDASFSAFGLSLFGLMVSLIISGFGTGGTMASPWWVIRWMLFGIILSFLRESLKSGDVLEEKGRSQPHYRFEYRRGRVDAV
jgi:hypothetical protein